MIRRRITTIAVLSLAGLALVVTPAIAQRMGGGDEGPQRMARRMGGRGMGPEFTSEQIEKIEQIHEKYRDDQVELRNSLKVKAVELQDIFEAGDPDFDAVEDAMVEMSELRTEMMKIRIQIHREIRPLLDEDQQVLFDKHFAAMIGHRAQMDGGRGMGRMDHRGFRHGARGQGARSGAGRGTGPGMHGPRTGDMSGPFCPWTEETTEG